MGAAVSAAKIDAAGKVYLLDARADAEEAVTEADVQEPPKIARLLARLLSNVATLRRAWAPRRIDFEDVPVGTFGAQVSLGHGFNGRVRWWIVGWQSPGANAPILRESSTVVTDANTLYLQSYTAGTACIRVEEAG